MLSAKRQRRLVVALFAAICLIGLSIRVYFYAINRSLWFDEALLARNLVSRSFLDLLKPLESDQAAPLGFLLSEKAVVVLLGNRDYILRLLPLLAGLASVPLMYFVSKEYGGSWFAFVSLALFALSPRLVYYSSELKQYSTDVFAVLVLLLLAPKCLEERAQARSFVALGIAGSLAIWFSHPSLFLLAGISLTLGLVLVVRRDSRRLVWLAGVGAAWMVSIGTLYLISLRHLASNSSLARYWSGSFAPKPSSSNLAWYYDAGVGLLKDPAMLPVSIITVIVLILGALSLALRRWPLMSVLLAPFLLVLAASALGRYPFSGRLLLFLVPLLLLLLAEGVDRVRQVLMRVNQPLTWLVSISLIVYFMREPVAVTCQNLQSPPVGEHIKPVMSYLRAHYQSTDSIYVYIGAEPAFAFYAPLYGFDRNDYIVGIQSRKDPAQYLEDVDKLRGRQRAWFVFSHNCYWCAVNEQDFILEYLDGIGQRRGELVSGGAAVYLYDLTPSPEPKPVEPPATRNWTIDITLT